MIVILKEWSSVIILLFARAFPGTLFEIGQGIFFGTIRRIVGRSSEPPSNYTKNDHPEPAPSGSNLELACRRCSSELLYFRPWDFLRNNPPYIRMLFGVQSNYTMNDHLESAPSGRNLEFACRGCSPEHLHYGHGIFSGIIPPYSRHALRSLSQL